MKKTLSIILASVIIISSLVALALPVSAEETEYVLGEWDVKMLETAKSDKNYPPLSGYHYDEKGFHTYSPNFRREHWGSNRRTFTVVSKEKFDIKNFSMTVVVHDYSNYKGSYNWISFSVWSESNGMAQGDTSANYGDGWTSLIRYDDDGIGNRFESWNQTIGGRSGKQQFSSLDDTQMNPIVFEPILDEETGDFTVTFAITDGVATINGTPIGSKTDECIAKRFEDGYAYVAFTLNNYDDTGYTSCPTISIIDVNGKAPYGDDRKEPESLPDLPTVESFQYVWCVGTKQLLMNNHENCSIYVTSDKSFKVNSSEKEFSMDFQPYNSTTWLSDREYHSHVVVLAKNLCMCDSNGAEDTQHMLSPSCSISSICNCRDHELIETERYCVTPIDENGNHIGTDCYSLFVYEACDGLRNIDFDSICLKFNNSNSDVSFEIVAVGYTQNMNLIANCLSWMKLNSDTVKKDEPPEDDIGCNHFDFDNDGFCDLCFEEMPQFIDPDVEETTSPETSVIETESHPVECYCYDYDIDGYCDNCSEPYIYPSTMPSVPGKPIVDGTSSSETQEEESAIQKPEITVDPDITTENASDIYDGEPLIVGCTSTAAFGAISIVAIIGSAVLIRKKED